MSWSLMVAIVWFWRTWPHNWTVCVGGLFRSQVEAGTIASLQPKVVVVVVVVRRVYCTGNENAAALADTAEELAAEIPPDDATIDPQQSTTVCHYRAPQHCVIGRRRGFFPGAAGNKAKSKRHKAIASSM